MATKHEKLFATYVDEFKEVKEATDAWWAGLIAAEQEKTGDSEQALINVKKRWPIGPVAHPWVIAVIRKYFFACQELNESGAEEVYPHQFVSDWLLEEETEDLADFVSRLTYWPLGLDEDGDFV